MEGFQIQITRKGEDMYKVVVMGLASVVKSYEAESYIIERCLAEELQELKITPDLLGEARSGGV